MESGEESYVVLLGFREALKLTGKTVRNKLDGRLRCACSPASHR